MHSLLHASYDYAYMMVYGLKGIHVIYKYIKKNWITRLILCSMVLEEDCCWIDFQTRKDWQKVFNWHSNYDHPLILHPHIAAIVSVSDVSASAADLRLVFLVYQNIHQIMISALGAKASHVMVDVRI